MQKPIPPRSLLSAELFPPIKDPEAQKFLENGREHPFVPPLRVPADSSLPAA